MSKQDNSTPAAEHPQPEALRLAEMIEPIKGCEILCGHAAMELRRQHAEIERLNSENAELYRKLAATSLSKDSGWTRYEQANQLSKITQDQLLAANEARRAAQDENALLKEKLATSGLAMQRSILEATKDLAAERDKLRENVKVLREFAQFVLRGLESGSVKAKPIVYEDEDSEIFEMRSLAEIASAALEATKEQL